MGRLVDFKEWVLRRRSEDAYFDWGFEEMEIKETVADRAISDVLQIFEDVTGVRLERADEDFIIRHWLKNGLSNHDFRLLIEYHFKSANERQFLDQPGKMNLRMMLNTSRSQRINDILRDLRFQYGERQRKNILSSSSPRAMMLMRCGEKISVGDKAAYDIHMKECFDANGKCFFG